LCYHNEKGEIKMAMEWISRRVPKIAAMMMLLVMTACGGGGGGSGFNNNDNDGGVVGGVGEPQEFSAPAEDEDVSTSDLASLGLLPAVLDPAVDRAGDEHPYAPVTFSEYTDEDGHRVQVQQMEYASLGLWLISAVVADGWDIEYRLLTDNRINDAADLPRAGRARYYIEADIVYKGERFYPDANSIWFRADFASGKVSGTIDARISGQDHFGSPTFRDGTPVTREDQLWLYMDADIRADGSFDGTVAEGHDGVGGGFSRGFFAPLLNQQGEFHGWFYDRSDRAPDDFPDELGGVFQLTDADGEILKGGLLGNLDD
jgi:hypothetical protein